MPHSAAMASASLITDVATEIKVMMNKATAMKAIPISYVKKATEIERGNIQATHNVDKKETR